MNAGSNDCFVEQAASLSIPYDIRGYLSSVNRISKTMLLYFLICTFIEAANSEIPNCVSSTSCSRMANTFEMIYFPFR